MDCKGKLRTLSVWWCWWWLSYSLSNWVCQWGMQFRPTCEALVIHNSLLHLPITIHKDKVSRSCESDQISITLWFTSSCLCFTGAIEISNCPVLSLKIRQTKINWLVKSTMHVLVLLVVMMSSRCALNSKATTVKREIRPVLRCNRQLHALTWFFQC